MKLQLRLSPLPLWDALPAAWKTDDSVAMARAFLEQRDPGLLPILADALEEAGFAGSHAAVLRGPDVALPPVVSEKVKSRFSEDYWDNWRGRPEPVWAERLCCQLASVETAAAVAWLDGFARSLGYDYEDDPDSTAGPSYTYDEVVAVGHRLAVGQHVCFWTDSGAGYFRGGDEPTRAFFEQWSLVTGVPVTTTQREAIDFRCAC